MRVVVRGFVLLKSVPLRTVRRSCGYYSVSACL